MFKQLGLIGCGLMGSSFALALQRAGLVERVTGFSPSPSSTAMALQMGVIDKVAASAALAVEGADLVLLAVPVSATPSTLQAIAQVIHKDTLVMDVGSTKGDVVLAARNSLGTLLPCFVPAHPICGKELSGVRNAEAGLYAGKKVILTPLPETAPAQVALARQLWQALGSHVSQMSPEAHDAAYAAVSHLPHLLAFAMMHSLQGQDQGEQYMALAGSGFRDFTRIAASEPAMWRDILLANRDELLAQSHLFQQSLQALEQMIITGDAALLHSAITQASQARTRWAQSSGPSSPHQD
ncbi:MAG: prephenate dehydrogenase/arogenate dehydrogenase family protein [Rhodoferax sp.]|nr:prephenate dehydrogenase/arogenate dehydrogenase family protein [Rhodoferax sp.]